jgi:hypothetical protein
MKNKNNFILAMIVFLVISVFIVFLISNATTTKNIKKSLLEENQKYNLENNDNKYEFSEKTLLENKTTLVHNNNNNNNKKNNQKTNNEVFSQNIKSKSESELDFTKDLVSNKTNNLFKYNSKTIKTKFDKIQEELIFLEEPVFLEPVYPNNVTVYNDISVLEIDRFDLNDVGILTQEFLDDQNGSVAFDFPGVIYLNDDLTFNNTIILSNNQEDDLTLNCQGHSITFDLVTDDGVAIWLQNTNKIQNCEIISDFTVVYHGVNNQRIGVLLEDESIASDCNIFSLDVFPDLNTKFLIGYYMLDYSSSQNCVVSRTSYGFKMHDFSNAENCLSVENTYGYRMEDFVFAEYCLATNCNEGFRTYDSTTLDYCESIENYCGFFIKDSSIINNCAALENEYKGFLAYDTSIINNSSSQDNYHDGFELSGSSTANNCVAINSGSVGFTLSGSSIAIDCTAENCQNGFYMNDTSSLLNSVAHSSNSSGIYLTNGEQTVNNVEVYNNGWYDPETGQGSAGIEVEQGGTFGNQDVNVTLSNLNVHNNAVGAFLGGTLTSDSIFCNNQYIDLIEYGITYINIPTIFLDNLYEISHNGTRNIIGCNIRRLNTDKINYYCN